MTASAPSTIEEAAAMLSVSSVAGERVRFAGGRTKLQWGRPVEMDLELSTTGLDLIVEHNPSDFTATAQAGVRLADAQGVFGESGQMLAVDPPLGDGDAATIGGVVATADSGPLRHLYKAPRDLLLGMAFCLPDGTVARAGGKVIKNVAGYDLAKLLCGSFGTLGMIAEVTVRLHPIPPRRLSVAAESDDPVALGRGVSALAHGKLAEECLDVSWHGRAGRVLARYAGVAPRERAAAALETLAGLGMHSITVEDDEALWEDQRQAQRAPSGAVVRVSALPDRLPQVIRSASRQKASVVGRAGLGLFWITIPETGIDDMADAVRRVRADLSSSRCVVLDAPPELRTALDPWDTNEDGTLALMQQVKSRFDPQVICNPGLFVGGI